MNLSHSQSIEWIGSQRDRMLRRVIDWSNINSYSYNVAGINRFVEKLIPELLPLGGELRRHDVLPAVSIDRHGAKVRSPLGQAIMVTRRPEAPFRVLLNIHLDTVYPPESGFQSVEEIADGKLRGPGVADAKGGIAVMLTAIEALERSPVAEKIGWQILLNPDEEIGSPGSAELLNDAAKNNHVGLLFEPALPDGAIVDSRRGSGNFSIIIRGRAAHAGRDFANGRNAVLAASRLGLRLHALNESFAGVTVNVSAIDGGGPSNIVPDLAICRMNVRTTKPEDEGEIRAAMEPLIAEVNSQDGISAELEGHFSSPPKVVDERTGRLLKEILVAGEELGMKLVHRASGGASDGNKLAAAGLANIDSLGVRGHQIHTPNEYLIIESLTERAKLTALMLLKLAYGDIDRAAFCR